MGRRVLTIAGAAVLAALLSVVVGVTLARAIPEASAGPAISVAIAGLLIAALVVHLLIRRGR